MPPDDEGYRSRVLLIQVRMDNYVCMISGSMSEICCYSSGLDATLKGHDGSSLIDCTGIYTYKFALMA